MELIPLAFQDSGIMTQSLKTKSYKEEPTPDVLKYVLCRDSLKRNIYVSSHSNPAQHFLF